MDVRIGASWQAMVPDLAETMSKALVGPFARAVVLVDSPGAARLLSQAVAEVTGLSAGVSYATLSAHQMALAEQAGLSDDLRTWRSTRLVTAIAQELPAIASEHPELAGYLAVPGRTLPTAARLATLFRAVLTDRPDVAGSWFDDEPSVEIPEHLAWQPELFRAACERLMIDPLELHHLLATAAAQDERPLWVFGLDDVPPVHVPQLVRTEVAWFVGEAPEWVTGLAATVPKPLVQAKPIVELHGSHSRRRQAEVLRDELVRHFEEDPTLEPRDVRIVCPQPAEWAPLLNAVFRAGSTHPGSQLRVAETAPRAASNLAMQALLETFDLADARATATGVVEYLLQPAIATRWGFAEHREDLRQLVHDARICWGLDAGRRRHYGIDAAPTGTWVTGIDALLTGICMGGEVGPRGVTGVDSTNPTDLVLLGALAEVIGRIWVFSDHTAHPLTVAEWCAQASDLIESLLDLPLQQRWMLREAGLVLARLSRAHVGADLTLTRREFRRLLAAELPSAHHRPPLGNGALHVVDPSEIRHVGSRLTAFIGLADGGHHRMPDEIPGLLPDPARRARRHLLAQARASERLLIVTRTRCPISGAEEEMPVTIRTLLRELDIAVPTPVTHAPQAYNPSAFFADGSFDALAHAGALASCIIKDRPKDVRRRAALALPVGDPPPEVTLPDLHSFLMDPIRLFLRHAANIRTFCAPEFSDQLPLQIKGLQRWTLTETFIRGRMEDVDGVELIRRAERSQMLPPGRFGQALAQRIGRETEPLVQRALSYMTEPARRVTFELPIGPTVLTGHATLHGEQIVVVGASSGSKTQLRPWLEILALAASRIRARAVVLRPSTHGPRTNMLRQPTPEIAQEILGELLRAFAIGRHRLLPVPFDPAFRLAMEQSKGKFDRREWIHPSQGAWPKWGFPDQLWRLFHDDPQAGLFADPPTALDPHGALSGFEAWAPTLYQPMIEQGASW